MKASPYSRYAPGAPALTGEDYLARPAAVERRDRPAYPVSAQERERSKFRAYFQIVSTNLVQPPVYSVKPEQACPYYGYDQIMV